MLVEVKQGILKGGKAHSVLTNKEYYYFSGIPYAEPPVGDLRFRPPVSAKNWQGIRSALEEGECCIQPLQPQLFSSELCGSEDCLYLNVYIPDLPKQNSPLKPVLVYIHGGAFFFHSGSKIISSPDFLMNYDIILITLNYRLHILGFLNLNIPDCCGNFGLKDQCLALKWIKENIRSFGGDPENITLFGDSAGAVCVQAHMISPQSKGLFQKGILQSGNLLGHWAQNKNPEKTAFEAGKKLGFEGENAEELSEFLRKQPIEKLVAVSVEMTDLRKPGRPWDCRGPIFLPSVEKIEKYAFLPDSPKNLVKIAKPMPVMTGVNEIEGPIVFMGLPFADKTFSQDIMENLLETVKCNTPCKEEKISELVKILKHMYFEGEIDEISQNGVNIREFSDFFSDLLFLYLYDSVDYIVKSNKPAYFYEFTFLGDLNTSNVWESPLKGSKHSDELGYLFFKPNFQPTVKFGESEKKVIHNICSLWTNFAKTGNPTPDGCELGIKWKPHTEESPAYLDINYNLKCVDEMVWNRRRNFWIDIKKTYFE